uniref:RxLR effector protein n=1 Tax=Chromera velia CCMP2878 TaxID=1169474 RepID=A0A0G4HAB6_9ALVE|eukprot:Cvel_6074.t1-p1 / transcript=Cvel_6074.t1 / gene=Cvel_6074 / organism=Chromera_velia_CCMP2878 / gene_product=hypothetical protein / transcript_product=hypothetical protein / location=Cvel_scaffold292:40048-40326(-) / protein_length=93 / sequence_SO=supercontig / SO=protein_coding / is_pseudo=false
MRGLVSLILCVFALLGVSVALKRAEEGEDLVVTTASTPDAHIHRERKNRNNETVLAGMAVSNLKAGRGTEDMADVDLLENGENREVGISGWTP